MDTPVLTNQQNLDSSVLYGHWILSRGLTKSDEL